MPKSAPLPGTSKQDIVAAISAFGKGAAADRLPAGRASCDLERDRRETFGATLAHEMRQPLAALRAAVEVIRHAADPASTMRATEVMARQISQMSRVVEDLLDAARWASGKVTLRKHPLDVRNVIKEAGMDIATTVAERQQDLQISIASEPLWVSADRQRLHQVFSNLLRNAIKYTNPGGRISVTADREPGTATVCVSDTGRGIESEALPHIFDLFSQVSPSEDGGLGIGLSVVREIVGLHDGRIEARSEGRGYGSEFIVVLPLVPAPASPGPNRTV